VAAPEQSVHLAHQEAVVEETHSLVHGWSEFHLEVAQVKRPHSEDSVLVDLQEVLSVHSSAGERRKEVRLVEHRVELLLVETPCV
jgi:hypothetical protein